MDSFKVADEGGGIIRVDAHTRLMRKPMAVTICDEVDRVVAGYAEFKILMNMGAISRGTPAAGLYVLGSMKKYPLLALALFGANRFMRGMAKTVLGIARFRNFELFEEEAIARDWLERADGAATAGVGGAGDAHAGAGALRRVALPASLLASAALVFRARRRRRRAAAVESPTAG
jgi:hypothetical protein